MGRFDLVSLRLARHGGLIADGQVRSCMAILVKSLRRAGMLVSAADRRQVRSGFVVLEQGEEVGEHETRNGEEIITFLEGTGELSGEGKTRTVQAPSVVLIPAHTTHNVRNKSDAPLKYVYAYVSAMDDA